MSRTLRNVLTANSISRLVDRLNNIKRNAAGDGRTHCALCNDKFHLFKGSAIQCKDCLKVSVLNQLYIVVRCQLRTVRTFR